ncbi:MAG: hypothetical protein COA99_01935 [Moraxellaceae bacterium]|nr:MAG: hypothetical protein COA99_01935 [Moraxellaceae bacterium]
MNSKVNSTINSTINSKTETQENSYIEQAKPAPNVYIDSGLSLLNVEEGHRIQGMVRGAAKKHLGNRFSLNAGLPLWPSSFFNLDKAQVFVNAKTCDKEEVVRLCSQGLVEESLIIEKCGMAFCAKMSALADSIDERMFYNLMSAEEAIHYHQISQFLPDGGAGVSPNPFHLLLARLIENGDRDSLVFIIQVVLEGWGISHYKVLADSCTDPQFCFELREILKDESRHHGVGVIFSKQRGLNELSRDFVVEVMVEFLQMVQLGPQAVVNAVEVVLGQLSREHKIELFQQLDGEKESAASLQTLRSLMLQNGGEAIVQRLDIHHSFTPYSAENCL